MDPRIVYACRKLQVEAKSVVERSVSLLRRLDAKSRGAWTHGEQCKPFLCVHLAAQAARVEVDAKRCLKYSGLARESAYQSAMQRARTHLGLRVRLSIRELAIQFGSEGLVQQAGKVLDEYRRRFLGSLSERERTHTSFDRNVFPASAFYLTLVTNKLKKPTRREILKACAPVREQEFANVCQSIVALCGDLVTLPQRKGGKKKQTKGEEAQAAATAAAAATPEAAPTSNLLNRTSKAAVQKQDKRRVMRARQLALASTYSMKRAQLPIRSEARVSNASPATDAGWQQRVRAAVKEERRNERKRKRQLRDSDEEEEEEEEVEDEPQQEEEEAQPPTTQLHDKAMEDWRLQSILSKRTKRRKSLGSSSALRRLTASRAAKPEEEEEEE